MLEDLSTQMTDPADPSAARFLLHAYPSRDMWTWAAAVAIAAELRRDLQTRARTRLMLSGGTTPARVYRALSKAPLEWGRVDVALVDERWLLPDDPDSNARLVRENLLINHAAAARFEPLTLAGRRIEDAVAMASAHGQQRSSVAVLGMGEDGHTASLFPHMPGLDRTLASTQPYVAVDATGCAGAQQWLRRISLTPAGLLRAQSRLLLLKGRPKREIFDRALASGDARAWPILLALDSPNGTPLHVYWCP